MPYGRSAFPRRNVKLEVSTGIITLYRLLVMHQRIPVVYSFFCNGMAELYPEIVGKIIGYSAIMITCHTGYTPILLVNRQSTSTIISIYHNILVGLLRKETSNTAPREVAESSVRYHPQT